MIMKWQIHNALTRNCCQVFPVVHMKNLEVPFNSNINENSSLFQPDVYAINFSFFTFVIGRLAGWICRDRINVTFIHVLSFGSTVLWGISGAKYNHGSPYAFRRGATSNGRWEVDRQQDTLKDNVPCVHYSATAEWKHLLWIELEYPAVVQLTNKSATLLCTLWVNITEWRQLAKLHTVYFRIDLKELKEILI